MDVCRRGQKNIEPQRKVQGSFLSSRTARLECLVLCQSLQLAYNKMQLPDDLWLVV